MAKKNTRGEVNKSAEIRTYLQENPKAKPAETVAALKQRGIDVTAAYVSSIKTSSKKRKKSKAKRRAAAQASKDTTPAQDVMSAGELMYQAVDLVMKAGFKEAKSLIEVAGKMVNKIRG
jgi:arginine repressor